MVLLKNIAQQMTAVHLRQRPAQMEMLQGVYDAIQAKKFFCVEAPTGTGKTLAYCLAGLESRKDTEQLIVSTATTALQEQFFQKDLLLLEKILDKKLNVVLAKGRRRYVCKTRLFHPEQYFESDDSSDQLALLQNELTTTQWNGEFDQLPTKIEPTLWQKISTDAQGCSAGRCEYFNECVFFQNRRKMYHADIVVTNHSLLLSDLELGGGVILPEMKDSIYILDECHHLPEKALSHFSKQAAVLRSFDWINNIGKILTKVVLQIKFKQQNSDDLNRYIKDLVEALRQVKAFLDARLDQFQENQWRVKNFEQSLADLTQAILQPAGLIARLLQTMLQSLTKAYEEHEVSDKVRADAIMHLQSSVEFLLERCENLQATWRDLLDLNALLDQPPTACWFEKVEAREGIDYTLHTSPINISKAMQELFWNKIENSVILCSATIRAMNSFNDFFRKLGLKDHPKISSLALASPFEHQYSLLFVPKMRYEPTQALQQSHLEEMLSLLPQLILPLSGTLVLFTSRKAMWFVYKQMPEVFKKNILLQDDYNKMDLLTRHKKKIDQRQQSIIFGLASFAEGIDLPGAYCQHVIIQKIPFSVPSDPIAETRADWLKKHNKDVFQLVSLPETSVKLAQYVGRLLRHEEDRGVVTILDKRLYLKHYGKALLASMPAFTVLLNCPIDQFLQHQLALQFYTQTT
jgi:ATP-dependent DNA helicase DinG